MVKSGRERTRKYLMSCLQAFMRGDKNLNWIVGVIRASGLRKEDFRKMFSEFRANYMSKPRFQQLQNACEQKGFL